MQLGNQLPLRTTTDNPIEDKYIAVFKGVDKKYNMDGYQFTAIKNAECAIPRGEITFVLGPSGSGKSTFLNMLGMLDKPNQGQITILGQDVLAMDDNQAADFRSRHIGFIFQSFNLIPVLYTVQWRRFYYGTSVQPGSGYCIILFRNSRNGIN